MPGFDQRPRPTKTHTNTKTVKTSTPASTLSFSTVEEIQNALQSQNLEVLTRGLTTLRNQFTSHGTVAPQDKRLLLLQQWLGRSPGGQDIFTLWGATNSSQTQVLSLIVSVLGAVLTLLSTHYTYHALGYPIIKTLLNPQWSRKMNMYLSGSYNDLILATLKLYNAISQFASGKERRGVMEVFAWETKSLSKLLNMRRKSAGDSVDPLTRPDIRTSYIFFILSFVVPTSTAQVKTAFLEHHREKFLSIFKGLVSDPYAVIRHVLEACWTGIWSDPKLKRTLKINLFSEITIVHIAKLYERSKSESDEVEQIPADLIHHFLLAICTRTGFGLCFKDRGWYPRRDEDAAEKNDDDEGNRQGQGKIHNRILANVLKNLKPNEDLRQQELALKILTACPELVSGYWSNAGLTLEPRLSSKWIANIAFTGSIVSLPIPTTSFLLDASTSTGLYEPTPPPLLAIMNNILPSVNSKTFLVKGLHPTSSALVQHCSSIALSKSLLKYEQVIVGFQKVSLALGEAQVTAELQDEGGGQWARRIEEIRKEMRRRVPDWQVIVAFAQQQQTQQKVQPLIPHVENEAKSVLLGEVAHRLVLLYHRCLPEVVAEGSFDVGKMLMSFVAGETDGFIHLPPDSPLRLQNLSHLHIIQLLKISDQFTWAGKAASSKNSYLTILLASYARSKSRTSTDAKSAALLSLLDHLLSTSILFQDHADEARLWLMSLPSSRRRAEGAVSPDGATFSDEVDSVVTFLEECIQRCLKTPYRYMEDFQDFISSSRESHSEQRMEVDGNGDGADDPDTLDASSCSPLLMTVFEQLSYKVSKDALSPSDCLALSTFIRKLLLRLEDIHVINAFSKRLEETFAKVFPQHPIMADAIWRECRLARAVLQHKPRESIVVEHLHSLDGFIEDAEGLPIPSDQVSQVTAAYELVDWTRLLKFEQTLSPVQLLRLAKLVLRLHPPALQDLFSTPCARQTGLWEALDLTSSENEFLPFLGFEWLFLNTSESDIVLSARRAVLVDLAFRHGSLVSLKRCINLASLHLALVSGAYTRGVLIVIGDLVSRANAVLSPLEMKDLKTFVFVYSRHLYNLCVQTTLEHETHEALSSSIMSCLSPTDDRDLTSNITSHWFHVLHAHLSGSPTPHPDFALPWIPFFPSSQLLDILRLCNESIETRAGGQIIMIVESTLKAMNGALHDYGQETIHLLLSLRRHIPSSHLLETQIAAALMSTYPTGLQERSTALASQLSMCAPRWQSRQASSTRQLELQSYLEQPQWSDSTTTIIQQILSCQPDQHHLFLEWIATGPNPRRDVFHLLSVVHAYLKAAEGGPFVSPVWEDTFQVCLKQLLDDSSTISGRHLASECVARLLVRARSSADNTLLPLLTKKLDKAKPKSVTPELLDVGISVQRMAGISLEPLIYLGLRWAVETVSSGSESDGGSIFRRLGALTGTFTSLKSHLVEPFLTGMIHSRLVSSEAGDLFGMLLSRVNLKPVFVNRCIQTIVQHPQFFRCCSTAQATSPLRLAWIKALHILFRLHPLNTCQPSHVEPLIRVYGGTLSLSDRFIFSIFQLFEVQRKSSISGLVSRWSTRADIPSNSALEAIQSLDAPLVLRSSLLWPKWRYLDRPPVEKEESGETVLYDPFFLMLILAQALAETPPESAFSWVELFRTNIVSLLLRGLSCKDEQARVIAFSQLAVLQEQISTADIQEKDHVVHILNLLKDTIPPPPPDGPIVRLPLYTTLLLGHALRGIFYPSNFIYPLTARFLLQRPTFDTTDVPMLYNMLYSNLDDWRKERAWMLRFLADGLRSTQDWRVFKRRRTWDLLASMFQSSRDRALRKGILEVLARLTAIQQAATSLILRSGLLVWIEMQLLDVNADECVAWVKIIENITVVVDAEKLEKSSHGQWRWILMQCLSSVLDVVDSGSLTTLSLIARTALRLAFLPGEEIPTLPAFLEKTVQILLRQETTLPPNSSSLGDYPSVLFHPLPPHQSNIFTHSDVSNDPVLHWGRSVESLWRLTMRLENKTAAWDVLTSRVLIWTALVGEESTNVGRWVRRQVIQELQHV